MKTEYEAEIAEMKAKYEHAIREVKVQQNTVTNAVLPAAQADQQLTIEVLEAQVAALKQEKNKLKAQIDAGTSQRVEQLERETAAMCQENSRLKGQPGFNRVPDLEAEKEKLKTQLCT